jgi:hypothetical protein
MVRNDHWAGITLVAPAGWRSSRGDLVEPLTMAVFPPSDRDTMTEEEAEDAELALWLETADPEPPVETAPFDADDDPDFFDHVAVYVGQWEGLEKEPPDEEGLLAGAVWLASLLDQLLGALPRVIGHQVEQGRRKMPVSGRPAAEIRYRFTAYKDGRTTAYLRLMVIQTDAGQASFVLGLAHSDLDHQLVDDCLDTVALTDGIERTKRVGGAVVREAGAGDERALAA